MSDPAIVVVGPGAMGCLVGGLLAASGQRVVFLDRRAERAKALAASGIQIDDPQGGSQHVPVKAVTELPAGLKPWLVVLCVKARDTASAVAPLAAFSEATVAVLQNGLGRAEEVGALLGDPTRVVGVLTSEGATLLAPGSIRRCGRGETSVGPLVPAGFARAQAVGAALGTSFKVFVERDLRRLEWEKVQVNAAINALTGILGCVNGALLGGVFSQELADSAAEEVGAVASAAGVPGDWSPQASRARWRAVAEATTGNRSSTLSDLRNGQKTEVFAINGAVAKVASDHGVTACVNKVLAQLVRCLEELETPPETRH